jgi:glycosyltransferase involved in cell wall biosynthesis
MLSYGLPVRGEKRGGIERAAHTLADGLGQRGYDVVVFSHDPRPSRAAYRVRELPWKSFVGTWAGRRVTMGYLGNVLALLPDYHEFDVIITHGDSVLLPLVGKPVLRVLHGSALGEARSATSIARCFLQLGVYAQELVTALTQRGVVAVSANTTRDNPFVGRVIPHGFDDRIFTPSPGQKTPQPSVLFVGSLDGRKRGRFLLDAFIGEVLRKVPSASLTFVGGHGPSHPSVTYVNGIEDEELATLYRRSWIYASPSTYEGFGLPYLEAMACGTPVVATENPGSVEVLDDGASGLMPSDSDFPGAVVDLLTDPSRRATLIDAGLRRAQHFTLARMLDEYEDVLFELTGLRANSLAA